MKVCSTLRNFGRRRICSSSLTLLLTGFVAVVAGAPSTDASPLWDGLTFSASFTLGGEYGPYEHTETDVVSGLTVTGYQYFQGPSTGYGCNCGSFEWSGNINPNGLSATITGSGTIHNEGVRPFTITSGGIYLNGSNWTLYWNGNDPVFGPIGDATTAPVSYSALAKWSAEQFFNTVVLPIGQSLNEVSSALREAGIVASVAAAAEALSTEGGALELAAEEFQQEAAMLSQANKLSVKGASNPFVDPPLPPLGVTPSGAVTQR